MNWKDFLLSFGADSIKLLITGILGGFVGSWISVRVFQSQKRFETKYQDHIRRRDVLRDILVILPTIFAGIHADWKMPEGSDETSQEHIGRLVEQINRWRTLFLDDPQMSQTIHKLYLLVGANFDSFLQSDKPGVQGPSIVIKEIEEVAKNTIKEIEKSLY